MSNYRPISVLSTVARVFEEIVYEQFYDYFEKNKFLTKYQSGFRRLHSTVTAMLKNTDGWLLKGNLRSKKRLAQMKDDLNAPNGSRDIPFQSQEFEQYGRRHFVDF